MVGTELRSTLCLRFDVEGKGLGGAEGLPYSSSKPFHGSCPAGRIHSEHALAALPAPPGVIKR